MKSNKILSLLAAWFRLVYTAVLATSINHLFQVLSLVRKPGIEILGADQVPAHAMLQLNAFLSGWDLGLLIFGAHLLVLGYLVVKSIDFGVPKSTVLLAVRSRWLRIAAGLWSGYSDLKRAATPATNGVEKLVPLECFPSYTL